MQGPKGRAILERLHDGPIGDIRSFTMGQIKICGRNVRALKHGMAAPPALEPRGKAGQAEGVRAAILAAGRDIGLLHGGARATAKGYRPYLSGSV